MNAQNSSSELPAHYPTDGARRSDLIVHVTGLSLAVSAGAVMLGFAISTGRPGLIAAIAVYVTGLIAMLTFSYGYNFAPPEKRAGRRKFDHAGIFVMIGASYTPFTTQSLTGTWSWTMTIAIWGVVAICALGRLLELGFPKKIWIAAYLALGWCVVFAFKPLIAALSPISLALLLLGGIIYSAGVVFYVNRRLIHAKAIWHGHVVTAAGLHWAAIFLGVVMVQV